MDGKADLRGQNLYFAGPRTIIATLGTRQSKVVVGRLIAEIGMVIHRKVGHVLGIQLEKRERGYNIVSQKVEIQDYTGNGRRSRMGWTLGHPRKLLILQRGLKPVSISVNVYGKFIIIAVHHEHS
jgi:hypothetical protein